MVVITAAETAMTPQNVSGNAPVACRGITVARAASLCSLKSKPGRQIPAEIGIDVLSRRFEARLRFASRRRYGVIVYT